MKTEKVMKIFLVLNGVLVLIGLGLGIFLGKLGFNEFEIIMCNACMYVLLGFFSWLSLILSE